MVYWLGLPLLIALLLAPAASVAGEEVGGPFDEDCAQPVSIGCMYWGELRCYAYVGVDERWVCLGP